MRMADTCRNLKHQSGVRVLEVPGRRSHNERMKNKNKVDVVKLQEEFFNIITEEASAFTGPGAGPSYAYLYGRLSAMMQGLMWVPELQSEMQLQVDRYNREQARLAVPAESI